MNDIIIIDFFDDKHIRELCIAAEFGLRDGNHKKKEPAYICLDEDRKHSWEATIINRSGKEIIFLPVDHNIAICRPDGKMGKRCDGILLTAEEKKTISFVELKAQKVTAGKWRAAGVEQLSATIRVFSVNHNIKDYASRNAYVCNSQKPYYRYNNMEELERFRKQYGVSLHIQPFIEV